MKKEIGLLTVESERMIDRSDPKWGHPLLREGWPSDTDVSGFTKRYKVNMSPEEYEEAVKISENMTKIMDNLPLPEGFSQEYIDYSECHTFEIPGCPEEPDAPSVTAACYVPKGSEGKKLPVIMHIPGGGLLMSSVKLYRSTGLELAYKNQAVVVIPGYRYIPFAKYPAPLNDCHAVYQWIVNNPEKLPIDTDNITLGGISSGAHLALCLGFRLKRYGFAPRGIVVHNPITDDRMDKESSRIYTYIGDWDGHMVKECGIAYLGPYNGGNVCLGPEAFANYATAEDCRGYAPTFMVTSEFDPDRDYNREFCGKLLHAGIYVEYHMFGGSSHSSSAIVSSGTAEYMEPLNYIVDKMYYNSTHYDLRRPWTEK